MLGDPEFLSDYGEKHALGYGVMAALSDEPVDRYGIPLRYPDGVRAAILDEYHYFELGRTIGEATKDPTVRRLAEALIAVLRAALSDPETLRALYPLPEGD